jgi:hypothetical protein
VKLGDLIYDSHFEERGMVVDTKPCGSGHHGEWCVILYEDGQLVEGIRSWEETIEVVDES